MNIMMFVHRFGEGMMMSAPALIGFQIGYGNVVQAKYNLSIFLLHGLILITFQTLLMNHYKESFMYILTDIPSVRVSAKEILFKLTLNVYPELYKNQMKGVIRALGLQYKAVWIHFFGNWIVMPCQDVYCVVFEMGLIGIWCSKLTMECTICLLQTVLIDCSDWRKIAKLSKSR